MVKNADDQAYHLMYTGKASISLPLNKDNHILAYQKVYNSFVFVKNKTSFG